MKKFFKSRFSINSLQLRDFIIISMLISLEIVFNRFLSINAWNIKIGFGFLPLALVAYKYGCICAAITAAMSDFIGAILFPNGPYFPGFTIVAALMGIIFGLFLYKNRKTVNTILAAVISGVVCTLLLNTLCITVLYHGSYIPILISRLPQFAFTTVAEIIIFRYLYVFDLVYKRLPNKKNKGETNA